MILRFIRLIFLIVGCASIGLSMGFNVGFGIFLVVLACRNPSEDDDD